MKKGTWQRPIKCEDGQLQIGKHNAFEVDILGRTVQGFTKQNSRGILKAYEDTNGDGKLNRGDELIARGRVEKQFKGAGSALEDFEAGSVKQEWKTTFSEDFPMPLLTPVLEFKNGEGERVGELGLKMSPLIPRDDFGI